MITSKYLHEYKFVFKNFRRFGCANPVFGVTKNCLNPDLTPGGSSGGESSLIGAGGSRLGIGSDIGGSVSNKLKFEGQTRVEHEFM